MSPFVVRLTEEEVSGALAFINEMREDKIDKSVTDRKFDKNNTSYAVNLMGYLGEVAVARVLGVQTDTTVRTAGDDGYDLVFKDKTIQVKTSVLPSLIFNDVALFTADLAILVQLVGDRKNPHVDSEFHIHGWITREEFNNTCYRKDYGYGARFVVDSDKLKPIAIEVKK